MIWKDIEETDGRYAVSSTGEVKRNPISQMQSNGVPHVYKERLLKKQLNNWGYYCVNYSANGRLVRRCIHRLVAEAFIDGASDDKQVNHKNGIKTDNRVKNLEWVTPRENTIHAFRVLKRKIKGVECIETGDKYESVKEAADAIGVRAATLSGHLAGDAKTCRGHRYKFTNIGKE